MGDEAAVREGDHGVRGVGVRPRGEERLPVAKEVLEDAVGIVHLDEPGSFGGALFNLMNKLQKRRVGAAEEEAIHACDPVLGELGLEACAGQGSGDLVVELVHVRTAGREIRRALVGIRIPLGCDYGKTRGRQTKALPELYPLFPFDGWVAKVVVSAE